MRDQTSSILTDLMFIVGPLTLLFDMFHPLLDGSKNMPRGPVDGLVILGFSAFFSLLIFLGVCGLIERVEIVVEPANGLLTRVRRLPWSRSETTLILDELEAIEVREAGSRKNRTFQVLVIGEETTRLVDFQKEASALKFAANLSEVSGLIVRG